MKKLALPFWNFEQGRPRALWRIVVQLVLAAGVVSLLSWPFNLIGGGVGRFIRMTGVVQATGLLISLWLAGRLLDHRPFRQFGFSLRPRWWLDFGFGMALGAFLMLVIFLVELKAGWITITTAMHSSGKSLGAELLLFLGMFVVVAIEEEVMARGYWLRNLAEGLNLRSLGPRAALWLAYLLSSSIFGLLHLFSPNATWISTFNLVLAGLFLGLPFVLSGELAACIGLHLTWNFFQGNVFGFPVSGGTPGTTIFAIQQGGPALLTGGAFGPEAGLIGLAAMGLGVLLILIWFHTLDGGVAMRYDLAVYTPPDGDDLPSPVNRGPKKGTGKSRPTTGQG